MHLCIVVFLTFFSAQPTDYAFVHRAQVLRVIDGDTFKASVDLGFGVALPDVSVRLLGVRAPELSEPGGPQAAARLRAALPRDVVLCSSGKRDAFGRILADVQLRPGTLLSDVLSSPSLPRRSASVSFP